MTLVAKLLAAVRAGQITEREALAAIRAVR